MQDLRIPREIMHAWGLVSKENLANDVNMLNEREMGHCNSSGRGRERLFPS